MEFSRFEEELIEVCTSLGKVSGLEFALLNQEAKTLYRLRIKQDRTLFLYRQQYKKELVQHLENRKEDEVLVFKDNLGLQYIGVMTEKLGARYIVVGGPFLNAHVSKEELLQILEENRIPIKDQNALLEAYKTMRILNQEEYLSLAKLLVWTVRKKNLPVKLYYELSKSLDFQDIRPQEIEESFSFIDERYRIQNKVMYYVSIGQEEEAIKAFGQTVFDFGYRVPGDPLRALKNQYLTFNTILRIAVERAGVSPLSIHQLSDNMAILIEGMQNIETVQQISDRLIREYCKLVQRQNTIGYSRHIQKALAYLEGHYDDRVRLSDVAEACGVSESHLSRQFKKETGLSMSVWLNNRRIETAKAMLSMNNQSITEVAIACGFDNINYFSKIFRSVTGETPLSYQKYHKSQE